MNKVFIYVSINLCFVIPTICISCEIGTCGLPVSYAMQKQRSVLENRLNDFKRSIQRTTSGMKQINKLCVLEAYEQLRLKQRKRIEIYKNMEIEHIGNTIKMQTENTIQ